MVRLQVVIIIICLNIFLITKIKAQTTRIVSTTFTQKGFYTDYGCTKIAYLKYEKTRTDEKKARSITACAELKDGIYYKTEQLDVKHQLVGSKKTQILVEKYTSNDCNAEHIDEIYTFPPPGPDVSDPKSYNWTAWSTYCTSYVGGSMEIIHHGKVTKHAQDLDEYRPKFSVKMHHDDKNCGSAIPQMLYIGDEDCHKLGITSYIGRRIDENVLDLLSIGSSNRFTSLLVLMISVFVVIVTMVGMF